MEDAEKLRREILARAGAVRDPLYVALAHSGESEADRVARQGDRQHGATGLSNLSYSGAAFSGASESDLLAIEAARRRARDRSRAEALHRQQQMQQMHPKPQPVPLLDQQPPRRPIVSHLSRGSPGGDGRRGDDGAHSPRNVRISVPKSNRAQSPPMMLLPATALVADGTGATTEHHKSNINNNVEPDVAVGQILPPPTTTTTAAIPTVAHGSRAETSSSAPSVGYAASARPAVQVGPTAATWAGLTPGKRTAQVPGLAPSAPFLTNRGWVLSSSLQAGAPRAQHQPQQHRQGQGQGQAGGQGSSSPANQPTSQATAAASAPTSALPMPPPSTPSKPMAPSAGYAQLRSADAGTPGGSSPVATVVRYHSGHTGHGNGNQGHNSHHHHHQTHHHHHHHGHAHHHHASSAHVRTVVYGIGGVQSAAAPAAPAAPPPASPSVPLHSPSGSSSLVPSAQSSQASSGGGNGGGTGGIGGVPVASRVPALRLGQQQQQQQQNTSSVSSSAVSADGTAGKAIQSAPSTAIPTSSPRSARSISPHRRRLRDVLHNDYNNDTGTEDNMYSGGRGGKNAAAAAAAAAHSGTPSPSPSAVSQSPSSPQPQQQQSRLSSTYASDSSSGRSPSSSPKDRHTTQTHRRTGDVSSDQPSSASHNRSANNRSANNRSANSNRKKKVVDRDAAAREFAEAQARRKWARRLGTDYCRQTIDRAGGKGKTSRKTNGKANGRRNGSNEAGPGGDAGDSRGRSRSPEMLPSGVYIAGRGDGKKGDDDSLGSLGAEEPFPLRDIRDRHAHTGQQRSQVSDLVRARAAKELRRMRREEEQARLAEHERVMRIQWAREVANERSAMGVGVRHRRDPSSSSRVGDEMYAGREMSPPSPGDPSRGDKQYIYGPRDDIEHRHHHHHLGNHHVPHGERGAVFDEQEERSEDAGYPYSPRGDTGDSTISSPGSCGPSFAVVRASTESPGGGDVDDSSRANNSYGGRPAPRFVRTDAAGDGGTLVRRLVEAGQATLVELLLAESFVETLDGDIGILQDTLKQ